MRTERIFLMELFLDDEVPKAVKAKIKERFEEIETPQPQNVPAPIINQAPSTQRILMQNPDLIPKPPVPVTPAAAAALAQRQALLARAGDEKPEPGRRSPRKM